MIIVQNCSAHFNIYCSYEDRGRLYEWLKRFVADGDATIYNQRFSFLEVYLKDGVIKFGGDIDVKCKYYPRYQGTRLEPPEPAYVEGYFNRTDFKKWLNEIIPDRFDVDIEIDDASYIPNEDALLEQISWR